MKTILFILGFMPLFLKAQDSLIVQPFEKCNTIIAKTGLTDEEAYKLAGRKLMEAGFSIEQANKDFYSIKSTLTATKNQKFNYYILMNVLNGAVRIEAIWKSTTTIEFWGVSTSGGETKIPYTTNSWFDKQYRAIFPQMIELARTLNPKEIVFEKN